MSNYKQVYKNVGTTPRTMDEAYKNAEYATPIYRMKSEWDDAKEFFAGLVVMLACIAFCVAVGYGFMAWVELYV